MKDFKNILITMLAPIIWGSTYIITSTFLPINRPIFVAFIRALPAGVILLLISRKLPSKEWLLKSFILGSLNIGGFFACIFIASYRISGGIVAMLSTTQTLFVMLLSLIILKEKPKKNVVLASIVSILGVILLVSTSNSVLDIYGVVISLFGAFIMSLGVVLTKYYGRPEDVLAFTSWQLILGSVILIPLTLILEGGIPTLNFNNYVGIIWLVVINTALGYVLWFRGISKLNVSKVSILGVLTPLTAFLLGYIFLNQTINLVQLLGIVIIIFSIYLSQKSPIKKEECIVA